MLPYKLRIAALEDVDTVRELALDFLMDAGFPLDFDEATFLNSFKTLVYSNEACIILLGDPAVGMLIGSIQRPLFSKDKIATEVAWYVKPESRGKGSLQLFAAYEYWAKAQGCKGIVMVHLGDEKLSRL